MLPSARILNVCCKNRRWFYDVGLILLTLIISGCSNSALTDITPPEFGSTHQLLDSNLAAEVVSPLLPPDPSEGKQVYIKHCAACHGAEGLGDGERAVSFTSKPPPLGSIEYSRKISPIAWFNVITRGKMDRLMPGYGTILSDRQRWDVTAYLLSKDITIERQNVGWQLYDKYCQSCHGPEAESYGSGTPSLVEPGQWKLSLDDIATVIRNGKGSMLAVKELSTEEQRLDTAIFLRSRQFALQPQTQKPEIQNELPVSSPIPPLLGNTETGINGRVVHGSGGNVPRDLKVELVTNSGSEIVATQTQTLNSDGTFHFGNLSDQTDRTYRLTLQYKGVDYSSSIIHPEFPHEWQNRVITIYEPSSNLGSVKAERMHIFFEFPRSDVIRVVQLYVLSNSSSSVITAEKTGDPVVIYPLPVGAQNLLFQEDAPENSFVRTPDGFGDTRVILPGSGLQVLFSYELPYTGDLVIPVRIALPVDMTNIMLPSNGISLKSSQLTDLGEKIIQNSSWHIFTSGALNAGFRLNLLVTGYPRKANPQADEQKTGLAVGVISLAVVLMMIAVVMAIHFSSLKERRNQSLAPGLNETSRDALLDAIIALDDQYHTGQIPKTAYKERRAELKNRLRGE